MHGVPGGNHRLPHSTVNPRSRQLSPPWNAPSHVWGGGRSAAGPAQGQTGYGSATSVQARLRRSVNAGHACHARAGLADAVLRGASTAQLGAAQLGGYQTSGTSRLVRAA